MTPDAVSAAMRAKFPGLAAHLDNTVIKFAPDPMDGRQLEFYPPWESDNPNKGKNTIEIYNPNLQGDNLVDSAAADMLHLLSATDPRTKRPVDRTVDDLKQRLISSRTQGQIAADREAFAQEQKAFPSNQTFGQWLQNSRADAYLRAGAFPAQNPEWTNFLTPNQRDIGGQILQHLKTPNRR